MRFISIQSIMDRVTKHPLLEDISFELVVDYVVDFIRIVGSPKSFIDKTAEVEIEDYRGQLPCDFYQMIQVRRVTEPCDEHEYAYRYTTDNFHISNHKRAESDYTYKIQGDCIFVSPLKDGVVEIAYKALPIDEDGYPMIPDNSKYIRAIEAYIKKQWFTIQFDLGKITQQAMMKADQDYAWAVGQAQSDMIRPSLDEMQSLANMWNSLIVRASEHRTAFRHEGTKERVRTH